MFPYRRAARCSTVLLTGLCLLGLRLAASPADTVPAANEVPSRIALTWSGDTARTQNVTWRTEAPLDRAVAQITRLDANPASVRKAAGVEGTATPLELPEGQDERSVHRKNLQASSPITAYCYRVGNGRTWSAWNVFRTAKATVAPFRFLYLGDAQTELRSMCSRVFRAAYRAAPDARSSPWRATL